MFTPLDLFFIQLGPVHYRKHNMIDIKEIQSALIKSETDWLENSYKTSKKGIRLRLFKIVKRAKRFSDKHAKKLLYHSKDDSAYFHLKSDFVHDELNALITNKENLKDPKSNCAYLIAASQILLSRKAWTLSMQLLENALKIAVQHELTHYKISIEFLVQEAEAGILSKNQAIERLFYRDLVHKKYKKAEKVINTEAYRSLIDTNKSLYYHANLQFVRGNFDESLDFLNQVKTKSNSGTKLNCRMLLILNYIETAHNSKESYKKRNMLDVVSNELGNYKKLIDRVECDQILKQDYITIHKILKTLQNENKENFDYKKTIQLHKEDINHLMNDHSNFNLQADYHIFGFLKWMQSKVPQNSC